MSTQRLSLEAALPFIPKHTESLAARRYAIYALDAAEPAVAAYVAHHALSPSERGRVEAVLSRLGTVA